MADFRSYCRGWRSLPTLTGAAALATFLLAPSALAQSAVIEEIVVTAQKREQSLIEVPASVSAISGETLEASGVSSFTDLTRIAPSMTVTTAGQNGNSTVNMRGIGTFAFSIGVEPSVSVIVDDVAVVQQAQIFDNLVDIERVEVLRGPQGTLFGKNASAGVVNIVTRGPSEELTGRASVSATNDDEIRLDASISGPIGDRAGFSLNGYNVNRDGYIDNLTNGDELNDEEAWGVRGKLHVDFSDSLDGQLTVRYSERDTDGRAGTFLNVPAGAALFGAFPSALFAAGINPDDENFNARVDFTPKMNNEQLGLAGRLNWQVGEFEVVSITSYQSWEYEFDTDVDGTDVDILNAFTGGALSGGVEQGGPFETDSIAQEFRLVSPIGEQFDYQLGVYFANAETDRSFQRGPIIAANWAGTTETTSYALYGHGTWHLADQWNLTGGLRLNREEIEVEFESNTAGRPCQAAQGGCSGDDDENEITGSIALQYLFAEDLMAYLSLSTGYKGQGYDVSTGFSQGRADNPVGSETSISYEIGMKGRVMDGRMQLAVAAFLTDYDDFQAQGAVIDPVTLATDFVLANVGELRTKGIEGELAFQATDSLRIDVSAALIDAGIEEFPLANCYAGQTVAEGCNATTNTQDLSGGDLANSPDFKFNIGAFYERSLSGLPFDFYANAAYQWQDDVNFDLFANPRTEQDAYGIMNVSMGIRERDRGRWELSLFVNNLFDETYAASIADLSPLYGNTPVLVQQLARNAQRFGGIRIGASF